MKKETGELLEILKNSSALSEYLEAASEEMAEPVPLSCYLGDLMEEKGIEKTQIVHGSGIPRSYVYDILGGKKKPSRDKVLAVCFAMHLTGDEVQELLKRTAYPLLYPRNERDSIILFGLTHDMSLDEVNGFLYDSGHPVIE